LIRKILEAIMAKVKISIEDDEGNIIGEDNYSLRYR